MNRSIWLKLNSKLPYIGPIGFLGECYGVAIFQYLDNI